MKVDIPFKYSAQVGSRVLLPQEAPSSGTRWKRGYIYGFQVGQLDKVAKRASIQVDIFLPSSEYEPLPISRSFLSTSKCATQIRHDHGVEDLTCWAASDEAH